MHYRYQECVYTPCILPARCSRCVAREERSVETGAFSVPLNLPTSALSAHKSVNYLRQCCCSPTTTITAAAALPLYSAFLMMTSFSSISFTSSLSSAVKCL